MSELSRQEAEAAGVRMLVPRRFEDDRGWFFESYNRSSFEELIGRSVPFVQDNHSRSRAGVLRGLHHQLPPTAQGKLVRCVIGSVFDVAVDVRRSSDTFGRWFGRVLSAENRLQMWIPAGFSHGFLTLTDAAELLYKTTEYYDPTTERSIRWDDPAIGIRWPLDGRQPLVSSKDAAASPLAGADVFD